MNPDLVSSYDHFTSCVSLFRAIQESLSLSHPQHHHSTDTYTLPSTVDQPAPIPMRPAPPPGIALDDDQENFLQEQLRLVLELSEKERREEETRMREEEEMLEKVLKLSLTET